MMSKNRRTFTREFKSKVISEALKEKDTLEVLAKKHSLLPGQISTGKADVVKNISSFLNPIKLSFPKMKYL